MYRWPAGRIIRLLVIFFALLATVDLAWHGSAYFTTTTATTWGMVKGGLLMGLAGAALLAGFLVAGFMPRPVDFLIQVQDEMGKVEWPTWSTIWRTTLVVTLLMAVLSMVTLGFDYGFQTIIRTFTSRN